MATTKSMKIQAEIDKVKAKISEQQARLKELEQKKLEAENSEIVDIVRGMSISLTELPLLFEKLKDGGTLGQSVPKYVTCRQKWRLFSWSHVFRDLRYRLLMHQYDVPKAGLLPSPCLIVCTQLIPNKNIFIFHYFIIFKWVTELRIWLLTNSNSA